MASSSDPRHSPLPPPYGRVPKSVKHLVLAAALADLGRWLAARVRRLRAGRPLEPRR